MDFPSPMSGTELLQMDEGKLWASVSYCDGIPRWLGMGRPKPITRLIYATRDQAYDAKSRIDRMACGGGCKNWHTVELALPKEKVGKWYDVERSAYERYGAKIPEIFLLPDERLSDARTRRKAPQQNHAISSVPKERSKRGVVYLLQAEGLAPIKIGHATQALKRVKDLQTGCPTILTILREIPSENCGQLEKLLHKRYNAYCVRKEWFALPPDVLNALLHEEFV